jgi:cobalt-zinc-cadmium efflux system membrane fusion protein
MKYYKIYTILAILALVFTSYRAYKYFSKKKSTTEAVESNQPLEDGTIKIDTEVSKDVNLHSTQVATGEFQETISLIGEVMADPDRVTKISARIPGRVSDVRFIEGARVKKGQVLAIIESPEAARSKSKYLSTLSRVNAVERNAKRIRELVVLKLAAEQEAINAESELKIQEAELRADKGNLLALGIPVPDASNASGVNSSGENSGRIEILSPLDGIILSREIVKGSQVDAITSLATVGNLDSVWFMVKLFEKDLGKVAEGDFAKVKLNPYPKEEFEGRLLYIGNQIDVGSRTVSGRIVIKNKSHFAKIGLFGTAELYTSDYNVLAVPIDSIATMEGKDFVFIEEKPGEYKAREVKLGRRNSSQVEVLSGLSSGEYIVDKGIFTLKSKFLKSTFGE